MRRKKSNFKTFYFLIFCIVLIGVVAALQEVDVRFGPLRKKEVKVEEPARLTYIPQFVLISFDGSRATDVWQDLRTFKEGMKKEGKHVNYTHFINASFFLTPQTKYLYKAPGQPEGKSNVGFGSSVEDVRARITEVNLAIASGDEIEPHTVGHFSGRYWSKEEWKQEFESFNHVIFHLDKIYPEENLPKINLEPKDIIGFRAPYLDLNTNMFEALHELNYKYDTSGRAVGNEWPTKDAAGMWRIPLGTLFIGPNRIPVLAMDYNLYEFHTHAVDKLKKGTPEWQQAYDEVLNGWLEYFNRNYTAGRAPVLVGYHFGYWNDGVYWEALKEFIRQTCGKPEVHCGTFKELVGYMEEYGVPETRQSGAGVL